MKSPKAESPKAATCARFGSGWVEGIMLEAEPVKTHKVPTICLLCLEEGKRGDIAPCSHDIAFALAFAMAANSMKGQP